MSYNADPFRNAVEEFTQQLASMGEPTQNRTPLQQQQQQQQQHQSQPQLQQLPSQTASYPSLGEDDMDEDDQDFGPDDGYYQQSQQQPQLQGHSPKIHKKQSDIRPTSTQQQQQQQQQQPPQPQSSQSPKHQSQQPQQQQVRLIQASFDDICDRQLLYIRGRKVIVTCIDYPLLFWRYIDIDTERQYAQRFLADGQLNNVTQNGLALSAHFYHSTLSAQDMGTLVSTSEFHRSYQATPSIFQIDVDDRRNTLLQQQLQQQQLQQQQQQAWDWPDYGRHNDHPGLLDTGDDDDDWADFGA